MVTVVAYSEGVKVAGGVVVIDIYRGRGPLALAIRAFLSTVVRGGSSARGVARDIVIRDTVGREVYREGPYDAISVLAPFRRVISEVASQGLDNFVRTKRVEGKALGAAPLVVSSGKLNYVDMIRIDATWNLGRIKDICVWVKERLNR